MWQRAQLLKQKVNEIGKSEGTDVVLVVTHYVMINALKEPEGEVGGLYSGKGSINKQYMYIGV